MGQQGMYFGSTMDIAAIRDQLRNLLSGLERFQGDGVGEVVFLLAGGILGQDDFDRIVHLQAGHVNAVRVRPPPADRWQALPISH